MSYLGCYFDSARYYLPKSVPMSDLTPWKCISHCYWKEGVEFAAAERVS